MAVRLAFVKCCESPLIWQVNLLRTTLKGLEPKLSNGLKSAQARRCQVTPGSIGVLSIPSRAVTALGFGSRVKMSISGLSGWTILTRPSQGAHGRLRFSLLSDLTKTPQQ